MLNSNSSGRETSGQDGGIDRYTLPPCTTKRRTTRNLNTKSNQNCQKIELQGSPTTKELKKRHPSRLVGRVETGKQVWRRHAARQWLEDCMVPYLYVDKLGGITGE